MADTLIITKRDAQTIWMAALSGTHATDLRIASASDESTSLVGNIYIGKVRKVQKNIDAAFIEIADRQQCYFNIAANPDAIYTKKGNSKKIAEGMMMLIRSMSPEVVAVDEIGDYGDIKAIESVLNCGCRLIATVHGSSVEDIEKKPLLQKMVKEHVFDRYIILSGKKKIGSVWGIFDGRGTRLYGEEGVVC